MVGAGDNARAKLWDAPFALAVMVAVCADETEATVAENEALVCLAETVTDAGAITAASLLARFTAMPPEGAAEVRLTVQASVPAPVIVLLVQDIALRDGVGVVAGGPATAAAFRLTTASPCDELLAMVREPV